MHTVLVGVGIIIIRGSRVLLGKRCGAHGGGTWSFPGGHLEFGEEPADCAKREAAEETGVQIKNTRTGPYTNDIFRKENKHYVTLYFVSDWDSGEPQVTEPEKFERWGWFSWGEFPEPLFLPIQNLLSQKFSPF